MDKSLYVKALDDLLVLFDCYKEDYEVVWRSLDLIASYKEVHPEHPVTLSLYQHLQKTGRL